MLRNFHWLRSRLVMNFFENLSFSPQSEFWILTPEVEVHVRKSLWDIIHEVTLSSTSQILDANFRNRLMCILVVGVNVELIVAQFRDVFLNYVSLFVNFRRNGSRPINTYCSLQNMSCIQWLIIEDISSMHNLFCEGNKLLRAH